MLHLIQIINHMIHLEYTEEEIRYYFKLLNEGQYTLDDITDVLNLDELTENQRARLEQALPKFESALTVCLMMRDK